MNLKTTLGFVLVVAISELCSGVTMDEFGMQMAVRAYEAICWWEYDKKFPKTNTQRFTQCNGQMEDQMYQMTNKSSPNTIHDMPDMWIEYFGKWTDENHMHQLPEEYSDKCSGYLKNAKATPKYNEGDALFDQGQKGYPFQAFAYCMMHTLRARHGDQAIEDVKNERTHSRKNWKTVIFERQNEFRARHGEEPFKLMRELNTAAQAWADHLAEICDMVHNKGATKDYYYNGESSGENLFAGYGDKQEVSSLSAANSWYEEIKAYPYPNGYDGQNANFKDIGHFTQSVWKGSTYSGYGYAFNPDCKDKGKETTYIVGRYWPAGNSQGGYPDNVPPVQEE